MGMDRDMAWWGVGGMGVRVWEVKILDTPFVEVCSAVLKRECFSVKNVYQQQNNSIIKTDTQFPQLGLRAPLQQMFIDIGPIKGDAHCQAPTSNFHIRQTPNQDRLPQHLHPQCLCRLPLLNSSIQNFISS
jgi:hypothetical protein